MLNFIIKYNRILRPEIMRSGSPASAIILIMAALLQGCAQSPAMGHHAARGGSVTATTSVSPHHDRWNLAQTAQSLGIASQSAALTTPPDHPTRKALQLYIQARLALMQAHGRAAMALLREARRDDAQSPAIPALMARVSALEGNVGSIATGPMQRDVVRALKLSPQSIEVNYIWGRVLCHERRWTEALRYLLVARLSPRRDLNSPLAPLIDFYLADALEHTGYLRAASEEYRLLLLLTKAPSTQYRSNQAVRGLMERRFAIEVLAGETAFRAGRYATALAQYQAAIRERPDDIAVKSRIIEIDGLLGYSAEACKGAVSLAEVTDATPQSMALLCAVYQHIGHGRNIAADLKDSGNRDGRGWLVLAVQRQQEGQDKAAIQALSQYLNAYPGDIAALERMIGLARVVREPRVAFNYLISAGAGGMVPGRSMRVLMLALTGPGHTAQILKTLSHSGADRRVVASNGMYKQIAVRAAWRQYLLGIAAEHAGALVTASGFYYLATQQDHNFWPAHKALVEVLAGRGLLLAAERQARDDAQQARFGVRAWRLLLRTYMAEDRLALALKLALPLARQYPQDRKLALLIADIYGWRGENSHRQRVLEGMVRRFPDDATAYGMLISLANEHGDWQLAEQYRHKYIRKFPASMMSIIFSASQYARQGDAARTEKILIASLTAHPNSSALMLAVVELETLLHHPQKSVAAIQKVLQCGSRATLSQARALSTSYMAAGKKDLAIKSAAAFGAQHARSVRWQLFHAQVLDQTGQSQASGAVLAALAAHRPSSERAVEAWAAFLADQGDFSRAITRMKLLMKNHGATPSELTFLAGLEMQAGNDKAIVDTYQRVLSIMPENAGANNDLGYYWANKKIHLRTARKMIAIAVKNYPQDSAYRDSMGWVLYQLGDIRQALIELGRAVSLPDGHNPVGLEHYAVVLDRLGHVSAAMGYWRQALALLPDPGKSSKHAVMVRKRIEDELKRARAMEKLAKDKSVRQL